MTRLHRIVVSVADLPASLTFYRDLLGFPVSELQGAAMLDIGPGLMMHLHERPSRPSDLAVAATFEVASLDALCARWRGAGGTVVDAPSDRPWGERMAVVRDPDGHLVCLTEQFARDTDHG